MPLSLYMCVGGEDGTVHYGEDIGFVVSKSVATHQQDEVTYQQCGNEVRDMTVFHGQRNDSGSTVAKGQTLHDTRIRMRSKVQTDAQSCSPKLSPSWEPAQ